MPTITKIHLPSGRSIPVLGQGTWMIGEDSHHRQAEIEALRIGLDLGLSLIDTAEMYAEGRAEDLVAEAIGNRRKEVFLVSKVLPQNATRRGVIEACEKSLRRLKTDYLDLYLLHWRGTIPLRETLEAFQILKKAGKILDYGVSNFDVNEMEEATLLEGGNEIVVNQILYNLLRRGIEWDLIPWSHTHKVLLMAYSPIEQGKLLDHPMLKTIAARHRATPAQIALAWVLQQKGMVVIPKSGSVAHVKENVAALEIKLTKDDNRELNQSFPFPTHQMPLETL